MLCIYSRCEHYYELPNHHHTYCNVCVLYMYTGDGVVAYEVAHLDGAIQITFDDVYHSISAPNLR